MNYPKITAVCLAVSLCMTGCTHVSEEALRPVLGLQWYDTPESVKTQLSGFRLLEERDSTGASGEWQKLLDYDVTDFYDADCTLTLCFTSLGLVGLNYHDVSHEKTYQEWSLALEGVYGIPTEESKGLSAWYENPLGKNTSIYLFNLEEGVQISFYTEYSGSEKAVISDTPDEEQAEPETIANIAPMPETRTPVTPVQTQESQSTTTEVSTTAATEYSRETTVTSVTSVTTETERTVSASEMTEEPRQTEPDTPIPEQKETGTTANRADIRTETSAPATSTTTTVRSTSAVTKTTTTETTTTEPPPPVYDPLNGLQFYDSPDSGRRRMSDNAQLYEYRTEEAGQPWELIMEYENVSFLGNQTQAVLCFTSLGLVGVNYFDENPENYQYWVSTLTDIYDSPSDTQYDYTAWTASPVGDDTQIYIFALEDGVQISFFADDTGSALS